MPTEIRVHQLDDLCNENEEILLQTELNTELHIVRHKGQTLIRFSFGNRFDIVDNVIIVKPK